MRFTLALLFAAVSGSYSDASPIVKRQFVFQIAPFPFCHASHLIDNLAPRDMETLQDHRETMEAFPDLKLKALDLRTQYETAVAELQKYERGQK